MWQNRLNKLRFGSFKKQSSEFAKPKAVVIFRFLMSTLSPAGSHYAMWATKQRRLQNTAKIGTALANKRWWSFRSFDSSLL